GVAVFSSSPPWSCPCRGWPLRSAGWGWARCRPARSRSTYCALVGALCLVAADLERYRPLVRFRGLAFALMSLALLGVDPAAGTPWWSASEVPVGIGVGR